MKEPDKVLSAVAHFTCQERPFLRTAKKMDCFILMVRERMENDHSKLKQKKKSKNCDTNQKPDLN